MKRLLLLAGTFFWFLNFIYSQAGKLDPSFGKNGIVKTNLRKDYVYGTSAVNQILSLPDGSMYVMQGKLTKRRSDGSLDSSFGLNGSSADPGFDLNKAAIQSDGKIVVAGFTGGGNVSSKHNFEIARYNTDGRLDTGFSGDGKQTMSFANKFNSPYLPAVVAIQPDGKIVVAGVSYETSDGNFYRLSLARCNTNGSLDSKFGGDGLVESILESTFYYFTAAIALQEDGKIVVAGCFPTVRYNSDGTTDETFSGDGISRFESIKSIAIQSDRKIVVSGYFNDSSELGRLNTDGSLDKSFSGDGVQPTGEVNSLVLQSNGQIVTVGSTYIRDVQSFEITRYNTNGSLDKNFSTDGKQATNFGNGNSTNKGVAVAIQSDGKIVAGGQYSPYLSQNGYYPNNSALARYNTDGSLDHSFDDDGKLVFSFVRGETEFSKTAIQKDGKIVVAGRNSIEGVSLGKDVFVIARYNTDGSLDSTFSDDGIHITSSRGSAIPSLAIQSDGKILVSDGRAIARYNADGSLDTTFLYSSKITVYSMATQNDGKILTAGTTSKTTFTIARYNTNGSPDETFGTYGQQTVLFPFESSHRRGYALSITTQKDGKIVVGGTAAQFEGFTYIHGFIVLVRLNTNGSLDNTFGEDGRVSSNLDGSDNCSIIIDNNGKIVISGGYSDDSKGTKGVSFKRFNTDGSIDRSFKEAGFSKVSVSPLKTSIALQSDGKILVSGDSLFRFNTDGTLDSTFNSNAAKEVDFNITDIAVSNNKLYAIGGSDYRSAYGAVARYLLANSNTPPTVSITTPAGNTTYPAPGSVKLTAAASDANGIVSKVEFYNADTLLHTETVAPYSYSWKDVPVGNYTVTAKATDDSGLVTTSAPVRIFVVQNTPPAVSIIKPVNNQSYAAPAYIHFEAKASDADGRITRLEFYNGNTLLRTEYKYPYTYVWKNIPAGRYIITAVAIDNLGTKTTSEPVTVKVVTASIVSSKPSSENQKTALNDALTLRLSPNPANNIVNILASELLQGKQATLSIISLSGIVLKTIQISNATTQLDVSALVSGVYTIKIISGDKVKYKQFIKL